MTPPRPALHMCYAKVNGIDPKTNTAWVTITGLETGVPDSVLNIGDRIKIEWLQIPQGSLNYRLGVPKFNQGETKGISILSGRSIVIEIQVRGAVCTPTKWCYGNAHPHIDKALNGADDHDYSFTVSGGTEMFGKPSSILEQLANAGFPDTSWPEGKWMVYDDTSRRFSTCHPPNFPTNTEEVGDEHHHRLVTSPHN